MNKALIKKFKEIVGENNVLHTIADRISFSYDASPHSQLPELIIFVTNPEELQKIVYICRNEGLKIFPRGAGTSTTGASIPFEGGISIVFTRMNRLLEFNEEDLLLTVEPGLVTFEIQKFLEDRGYFYPPDPSSLKICTIGGNVMTNAGGPRAIKYGVTKDYIISLKAITGFGEDIQTSPKTHKYSSGYNLTSLLVGSEGTLALVYEITLKFLPRKEATSTIMATFQDCMSAMHAILDVFRCGILPSCIEYLDHNSLSLIHDRDITNTMLICEVDGHKEIVNGETSLIKRAFEKNNVMDIKITENPQERDEIWNIRRGISAKVKMKGYTGKISEDICVSRHNLPLISEKIESISKELDIKIIVFGHAGDGNLHVNFLFNKSDSNQIERVNKGIERLMEETIKLGGAISGEHGIGLTKKDFIYPASKNTIPIMKEIKKTFDPDNILNPGKVFDL